MFKVELEHGEAGEKTVKEMSERKSASDICCEGDGKVARESRRFASTTAREGVRERERELSNMEVKNPS